MVTSSKPGKKAPKGKTRELLPREARVLDWTVDIHARGEGPKTARRRESSQYMIVEGELTEPLGGVTSFLLQLWPDPDTSVGTREIASVGSVIQVKPTIQVAASLTPDEFHSVFLLASSGKLRSVYMAVQEPRYGRALVASFSFSSRPPEIEEASSLPC
jgi:hypothetical protein